MRPPVQGRRGGGKARRAAKGAVLLAGTRRHAQTKLLCAPPPQRRVRLCAPRSQEPGTARSRIGRRGRGCRGSLKRHTGNSTRVSSAKVDAHSPVTSSPRCFTPCTPFSSRSLVLQVEPHTKYQRWGFCLPRPPSARFPRGGYEVLE